MTKKRKKASAKKTPAVKVKKVVLPASGVVRVVAPKGVFPVAVVDPVRNVVEIVPVPRPTQRSDYEKPWWKILLGKD